MFEQAVSKNPLVSVIITCKNRLEHLKQSLPKLCAQEPLEVIVVDYGCLEGTRTWVKNNFPNVRLVCVDDDPVFSLSRARNMGASYGQGKFLMFSDADIIIDFSIHEWVENNSVPGEFYTINPKKDPSLCGTAIINKNDFHLVGKYDEAFRGWGGEDVELYKRLIYRSIQHKFINDQKISAIQHDDNVRLLSLEQGGGGSRRKALMIAKLYTNIIIDLYRNNKYLTINDRMALMSQVKQHVDNLESKDNLR
jgi:glycosyltransferase involved in cell wall biosynthesis